MDHHMPPHVSKSSQEHHHDYPPVSPPRSQHVSNRSSAVRTPTNSTAPRYFSAPFRAPPSRQEQHESLTEHQKSRIDSYNSESIPQAHHPQRDRASYTVFQNRAAIDPLHISKRSNQTTPVNNASNNASRHLHVQRGIGHNLKPDLLNMKRPDSGAQSNRSYTEPKNPPPRPGTIEALNAAIAAASKELAREPSRPPMSHHNSSLRAMHDSPTSTYSQDFSQHRNLQVHTGNYTQGRATPLEEEDSRSSVYYDPEPHSPLPEATPHSVVSTSSTNPLLGLGIAPPNADDNVPEGMRPPQLNMGVVDDFDARGSITSLPDLIRRATKLASNLDRGRTASRLGLWEFFGNPDQSNARRRESTFSDVLNAFPDPVSGIHTRQPRASTIWPGESREALAVSEKQEPGSRSKQVTRRCCGMSMTVFIFIVVIVILLIAAAVLIPIFLVVIPREQHNAIGLNNCATSRPCSNNGVSVIDNNACSCVCVDGFTGSDCSKSPGSNCVTADLAEGSQKYRNATLGTSILPLLAQAQNKYGVPLNNTALLSVFASNNLSCVSENSLVQFDTNSRRNNRRFVIVHGINAVDEPHSPRPVPVKVSASAQTPTAIALFARQTGTQTASDVVSQETTFQATATATAVSTTSVPDSIATAPPTTSDVSPLPTTKSKFTSDQFEFAQVVVLYVLAESRVPSTAVMAQQNIEQYLRAGGIASGNSTVGLGRVGKMDLVANFAQLAIAQTDGKLVAGKSTKS